MRIIKLLETYTPIAQFFCEFEKETDTVFLDSSLKNEMGRYSILGRNPYLKLIKGKDGFTANGEKQSESFETYTKRYLEEHREENESNLPIVSGAIGYFSYEYGREKEGVQAKDPSDVEIPDCILNFYDEFIVEDLEKKQIWLVANGKRRDEKESIEELEYKIGEGIKKYREPDLSERFKIEVLPNFEKEQYMKAIDDMIHYIIEGDIYIANMTQHLKVKSEKEPYEVFEKLRSINPSPFGGYLNYGEFQIVCASPERFLQMKSGHVETRPIKGTRKRGSTKEEDLAMKTELENSEKDKSELLMIVDLERNDLNRVCKAGSVKVTEMFTVETYATVFHLVSNVVGELREDCNVMDLIEAAFPGGSITGAPKLRAMEIIDELEHGRRNIYTGSIGYLTLDGNCDFNIVIRTALYSDGIYHLGVGGGITYESELEFEYEETLQKAKAVLEAMK